MRKLILFIALASMACGSDDATSSGQAAGVSWGELKGETFDVVGSAADFNEVSGRSYVSISIYEQEETCSYASSCVGGGLNFTLSAVGGALGEIKAGTYRVGEEVVGAVTYELVGAAGRSDADCAPLDGGFADLSEGTVTLTEVGTSRVKGNVQLTTAAGDTLSGSFDALVCEQIQ